ncbi:RBBP9/YdeN family alpha/beta hydrolase [Amorphus sp. 3PC139-8]|uniref:RBBP9/YdeN family alpha/beta hydrolase n=1 Tax=Amorphus sp. 3PC139-8 TaxID=2735676 RepID=UPI00345D1094
MVAGLLLPGIGGSGAAHWQSHWEAENRSFQRFRPADWDQPDLIDWLRALEVAVTEAEEKPVLIAHSLACLLVAHAAERVGPRVRGAFLVAVPDPDEPAFPDEAAGFGDPPTRPLPFPTLIVGSTDDPYGSLDYVRRRAREWNAGLVDVGARGHINGDSGLGAWKEGRMLLEAFCAGLRG